MLAAYDHSTFGVAGRPRLSPLDDLPEIPFWDVNGFENAAEVIDLYKQPVGSIVYGCTDASPVSRSLSAVASADATAGTTSQMNRSTSSLAPSNSVNTLQATNQVSGTASSTLNARQPPENTVTTYYTVGSQGQSTSAPTSSSVIHTQLPAPLSTSSGDRNSQALGQDPSQTAATGRAVTAYQSPSTSPGRASTTGLPLASGTTVATTQVPGRTNMPQIVDSGTKPGYYFHQLAGMAIVRSQDGYLSSNGVGDWVYDTFAFYRLHAKRSWRHTLTNSLYYKTTLFRRAAVPSGYTGVEAFWKVAPGQEDQFIYPDGGAPASAVTSTNSISQGVRDANTAAAETEDNVVTGENSAVEASPSSLSTIATPKAHAQDGVEDGATAKELTQDPMSSTQHIISEERVASVSSNQVDEPAVSKMLAMYYLPLGIYYSLQVHTFSGIYGRRTYYSGATEEEFKLFYTTESLITTEDENLTSIEQNVLRHVRRGKTDLVEGDNNQIKHDLRCRFWVSDGVTRTSSVLDDSNEWYPIAGASPTRRNAQLYDWFMHRDAYYDDLEHTGLRNKHIRKDTLRSDIRCFLYLAKDEAKAQAAIARQLHPLTGGGLQ